MQGKPSASWYCSGNNRPFGDIKVAYDFERQALRLTQTGDDSIHLTTDSAVTNELFGATNLNLATAGDYTERNTALASIQPIASADGDNAIVLTPKMIPGGDLISETRNQRMAYKSISLTARLFSLPA